MGDEVTVAVLVPYRAGGAHRSAAWEWIRTKFVYPVVVGRCADGPFNRVGGILDAAQQTPADVLVVTDADVWCDGLEAAVSAVEADTPWAIPHLLVHRLSEQSTEGVLTGADWRGLELSGDNRQDRKPYKGHETGGLVVIHRDALFDAPPDPRFVGWGSEDDAWATALRTLVGKPWRGTADLVHLWHPPQPRTTRTVGTPANRALLRRYRQARGKPAVMRALLAEVPNAFSPPNAATHRDDQPAHAE